MAETCSALFPNCSQYSLFISIGWMMSQPEMMNYGVANQTSELPLALLHTPTCVLLDRPCTETKEANEGPVGLWIRRLYQGFNVVLFIPLGRGVTLILSTSPQQHTSTMFLIVCFCYGASLPAYLRTKTVCTLRSLFVVCLCTSGRNTIHFHLQFMELNHAQ